MVTQSLSHTGFGAEEAQSLEDSLQGEGSGLAEKWLTTPGCLATSCPWGCEASLTIQVPSGSPFFLGSHEWLSAPCPQIGFKEYDEPGAISSPTPTLPAFGAKFAGEFLNKDSMTKWMNSEWYKIPSFDFFQEDLGHSTLPATCLLIKHQWLPFSEYLLCARHHAKLRNFQSGDWFGAGPWANHLSWSLALTLTNCVTLESYLTSWGGGFPHS